MDVANPLREHKQNPRALAASIPRGQHLGGFSRFGDSRSHASPPTAQVVRPQGRTPLRHRPYRNTAVCNRAASRPTDQIEKMRDHQAAGRVMQPREIAATHDLQSRDAHFCVMAYAKPSTNSAATNSATHTPTRVPRLPSKNNEPSQSAGFSEGRYRTRRAGNRAMGATGLEPVTSAM